MLTPNDSNLRASFLHILGPHLENRSQRIGPLDDLNQAIEANQQAIMLTPINHSTYPAALSNLTTALMRPFEKNISEADLNQAIDAANTAVALTPKNHPRHVSRLDNLSAVLEARFKHSRSIEDLNHAFLASEVTADLTPEDHPIHAASLHGVGGLL